ncbi:MAG: hypothetical protein ABR540_18735 [Acidimicrobiales bacterium]
MSADDLAFRNDGREGREELANKRHPGLFFVEEATLPAPDRAGEG